MRLIATIEDGKQASRFSAYLLAEGINNTLEESPSGWTVWVHEEHDLERAQEEYRQFQWHPKDPRYQSSVARATEIRRQQEDLSARRAGNIIKPRAEWTRDLRSRLAGGAGRTPMGKLTFLLVAVSVVLAVVTRLGTRDQTVNWFLIAPVTFEGNSYTWDGLNAIFHGQVWRIITPIFLHFGLLHILFNMWWLKDLGSSIEARKGPVILALLVVLSGVVANLAQYSWSGPLAGGMSGVIYALFGYMWLKGKLQPSEGLAVDRSTVIIMIGWLFFCMTGLAGNIGNAAHVSGLLTGLVLAWLAWLLRRLRRTRPL